MEGEAEGKEGGKAPGLVEGLDLKGVGISSSKAKNMVGGMDCICIPALDIGTFGSKANKERIEHEELFSDPCVGNSGLP